MQEDFNAYTARIRSCCQCADDMTRAPNPVFQATPTSRILIAGQAPGNLADQSGIPFSDPSGVRLRDWLGVSEAEFYDAAKVAIIPMGFCFPGYDKAGGDLPPMKRCANVWRSDLLNRLPHIRVTVLVGGYAQKWHLGDRAEKTLTQTVAKWRTFTCDGIFATPHPSWRNNAWLKKHPWFQDEVLPELRLAVRSALS